MNDTGREFRLGEDFFRRTRRNTLTRGASLMALIWIAVVLVPAHYDADQTPALTLSVGSMLAAIMTISLLLSYRRTVARYRELRIVLFPQALKHSLPGQEDVYITAGEVSRVITSPGNGTGVQGMAGQQAIWLPATLAGYEELMRTVETWRTPEIKAGLWSKQGAQWLATAAFIVAMAVVMQAQNRTLVTAVGVPLLAYMGWAAIALQRSPFANPKQKRAAGVLWLLMALFGWKMVTLWLA